ncbi:MAG TPA: BREX system ATP-binding domain-containing protein, partial [Gemmatimonas sp.]|nr:BREX system ATP-binding domain-containing protein [Gemmatimonas sp.]
VRGVRAALALRERVGEIAASLGGRFSAGLRLRAGVHVGAVVAQRSRDAARSFRITGQPADIAARLAAAADSDTILVSPETRRMVAPFVHTEAAHPVAVHGDGTSVVPHRLLRASDVRSRLEGALLAGLTPFVGRTRERLTLRHQIDATVRGEGQFTIVVGEAGAGKSRLLHELRDMAAAQELRVVVGRCDAYGRSTAFLPFIDAAIDILRLPEGGSIPERHEAVVAGARAIDRSLEESLALYLALLAIPSAAHPVPELLHGDQFQSAMLGAIAALFTLGSRSAPAVLLLEDWHWADDASHAALMQLAEIVPAFPLLIVVTARPDASVDWGTGEHQTLLHLAPLDGTASGEIACAVFGANRIAPALVAQLHERTGGNSFFLEEVCVALREEGSVTVQDGQAAASDSAVTVHVPETVQGVLRTRMDRLDQDTGEILRVAAVIGREFTRGVLEDVVESTAELGRALERLKSSGLVQQTAIVPEPAYRFKHALTQEVAYDSLLEHQRTSLHAAVGHAIVARYAARLDEHVDLLAHHFSSAEAWEDAVRHGVLAADRASGLGRNADALQTLERVEEWALHLLDDDARRDLLADVLFRQERLSEMLGLRTRQLAIVESLIALLAPHGPSARLAQVYLRQGDANTLLNRYEAAERALETALRISRDRADGPGERNALRSIALLRSHQGRHADALERIEQVLALGQHAGDTRAQAGDLATMGNVLRALGELPRALSVLEAALERTEVSDNRTRYGALLHVIGNVYRDMGKADTALEYFWRTRAFMPDTVYASFTLPSIAHIQLQQGHVAQAIRTYEESVAMNRKVSYADGLALSCRALGEVLVGLARNDEAVPYLTESATLFAQIEDWQNEALMWRRLATVYEQLQRPELARATWERMRAIHHANENSACEVDALEGIARAERQLAAPVEDVVARYDEALSIALRQGDRPRELAIRNSLGIAHWQRGAYGDAVRQYELALRVCRETGDRVHEGLILNSLGACLNRLRRWDEAQTTLAEAIRVTAETGEMKLQAHALAALAEVCIGRGRVDDAIVHLTASLAFRRLLDDRRGEGWMQQRLAVAYGMNATTMSQAAVARDEALRIASEIDDSALQEAVQQLGPPQFTSPTSVNQANAALHHRT